MEANRVQVYSHRTSWRVTLLVQSIINFRTNPQPPDFRHAHVLPQFNNSNFWFPFCLDFKFYIRSVHFNQGIRKWPCLWVLTVVLLGFMTIWLHLQSNPSLNPQFLPFLLVRILLDTSVFPPNPGMLLNQLINSNPSSILVSCLHCVIFLKISKVSFCL